MSVAENVTVEIRTRTPPPARRGGRPGRRPLPEPRRTGPRRDAIDLRHVGEAGLPAGGPYPNLSLARR